jgi:hypothetical protein
MSGSTQESPLFAMLDDGLDELPRYFAVVDQSEEGWDHIGSGPYMVPCVSVDDVRAMLRRKAGRGNA